ncbi:MAG: hypothetical protein IRY87_00825 [Acetobacteraceae bacterium]|nr:hypothetical protein [Acetobacteraceae bacterium]
MRRAGLALLALLAAAPTALAASGEDPGWPCQQRLVPRLEAGTLWPGPAPPENAAWRDTPEVAALVARITPRNVPEAEGLDAIKAFAAPLSPAERRRLLPLTFAGLLEETNRQRSDLITRIKAFARRQHALAEVANRAAKELETAPAEASGEAAARRTELEQRRFFTAKAFQDAERTMRYACEMPVQLEARLGAYARVLQAAMPNG